MRTDRADLFARAACEARERRPYLSEVRPAAASIGRVPVDSACPCLLVLSRDEEEVVRLDPARKHVGDAPASPWRRTGAPV